MPPRPAQVQRTRLARLAAPIVVLAAFLAFGASAASAHVDAAVSGGVLTVTGDAAPNNILVAPDPSIPGFVIVDVGADGTTDFRFDSTTVTSITLLGRGGDDTLQATQGITQPVTLDGSFGNDTLLGGGVGDTLLGGPDDDLADGNRGNDTIDLGDGDDTVQWDPGDGSDTVVGGAGKDQLNFNGSNANEHIDLSASGSHAVLHRDVAAITMDMTGLETAHVRALGGTDAVTVGDLTGTDLRLATVDLGASDGSGDGAADVVTAVGTDGTDTTSASSAGGTTTIAGLFTRTQVTGAEAANDDIDVNLAGGADQFTGTTGLTGPNRVVVNGGDGIDSTIYRGTNGPDNIGIANDGTAAAAFSAGGGSLVDSTAVENLVVRALGGDDTVTGQNGLATLTRLTIDGGTENDTLAGGDGDDAILGGPGDDHLDGNRGADVVEGADGNDTFQWDPGDGSDLLEGGVGNKDKLDFNGSNAGEKIAVAANGGRVRLTRDVAAINMDFAGIEDLAVHTLGSADTVTLGDLTGTDLRLALVDLGASGGGGDAAADSVIVNGTDGPDHVNVTAPGGIVTVAGLFLRTQVIGSEPANDTLALNALGGTDVVNVFPPVASLINPVVDLGPQ